MIRRHDDLGVGAGILLSVAISIGLWIAIGTLMWFGLAWLAVR